MAKFFVDEEDIGNERVFLRGNNANHIVNVLRLKIDDEIEVCSGDGLDYLCKIDDIAETNKQVTATIIDCFDNITEPNIKITLYQGLPKAEKMELIIQKCVELGINEIIPVSTDRSIVKLSGKEDKKISRWNKISETASKQSKRGKIPNIGKPLNFKEAIEHSKVNDKNIIPYEKEKENSLKKICEDFREDTKSIGIFIGPEGGFSDKEIELAKNSNIIPITLGKRILRTETAGFITTAILLYELENF